MRQHPGLRLWAWAILATFLHAAGAAAQSLPPPQAPPGNAPTPAKINLGKVLFWDEQLSSGGTVSCGTCHIPRTGGGDPRSAADPLAIHPGPDATFGNADDVFGSPGVPLSSADGFFLQAAHFGINVQTTTRRTTSAINAAYSPELFWDGRAGQVFVDPVTNQQVLANRAALETQAMGPPMSEVEMGHRNRVWTEALTKLGQVAPLALAAEVPTSLLVWIDGRSYPELFAEAFGTTQITAARVGMAIASYERQLFTNQTPFDDFLDGNNQALNAAEQRGRNVFNQVNCNACHAGALLSDNNYHYIGVRPVNDDLGRFVVTNQNPDRGRMRTPSLRNLELRAPYMHNGRLTSIEAVVDFYNRGGDFDAPNKDPRIVPLGLSANQRADLAAFLRRPLTDQRLVAGAAPFDRPVLYSESRRAPVLESVGQPGSGNRTPLVVAVEPAMLGNPRYTVGVQNGLGGAFATLVIHDSDPGLTLPVSGALAFETLTLGGAGAGGGFGSVQIAIPSDAALAGRQFFGRWYVNDGAAAGGVAVSQLFRFEVFPPLSESLLFVDDFESGTLARWNDTSN